MYTTAEPAEEIKLIFAYSVILLFHIPRFINYQSMGDHYLNLDKKLFALIPY